MNFNFVKESVIGDDVLRGMYDSAAAQLARAEELYRQSPQECGMLLRDAAKQICLIYNYYYQVGYPEGTPLEGFLCYTDDDRHNSMVSLFLSVLRKEQRDRLNRLRVYGDDCILGREAPDQGMTFEDRMTKNARRMMETMMEVTKDMCRRINKREDVSDRIFSEELLPESGECASEADRDMSDAEPSKRKSWLGRLFGASGKTE